MRSRSPAEVLTGAVVLLVAAGFLFYAVVHSGRASVGGGYTLVARFDRIDGLPQGADVRVAGVKVGNVTDTRIDPRDFLAVVTMRISDVIKLPKDSSARILPEGLLGGNYIALEPGGDEAILQPGQSIANTQSAINLADLLGKFIFSGTAAQGQEGGASGGTPPR